MKVLVTGAGGQLGRELQATCPHEIDLTAASRADLDLTHADQIHRVLDELRPDLIVNAAAYTAVDQAESDRDGAFAVNALGARDLALGAREVGARMIHFSTDFVFDGRRSIPYPPDSATDPQSVYGASKLAGENHVLETCGRSGLVIRTAWVYSRFGANFVKTMLRLMTEREEVSVVMDQIGTPTWTRSLADLVWTVCKLPDLHGTYHWTDAGVASWYDFAIAIQEEATALAILSSPCRVLPVTTADFPTAARRPSFSVLDTTATRHDLGLAGIHWRRRLRTMLETWSENRED